jgi:hypothetical protein
MDPQRERNLLPETGRNLLAFDAASTKADICELDSFLE